MKTPSQYLDDLKAKTGSDYASAKLLETRQTTLSSIRKRDAISEETAVKLAELLNIEADEILISAAIARSEGAVKTAWIDHAKKVGIAASLAGIMLLGDGVSNNAYAQAMNDAKSGMYIMSNC